MQRKLASLQRVLAIEPIPNADAIELVQINGWQCVTKKGAFQPGDLGVYLEIDAVPPDMPRFRFLWTPKNADAEQPTPRPEKFRIRTLRLRGALSQGLFLPLSEFPELVSLGEGDDATDLLDVGKYEPPVPVGMGDWRGPFPSLVPKTDEMRIQSFPAVLDEIKGLPYAITLKYDGTSATYCLDRYSGEFHACGRNQSIQDGPNLYWDVARTYGIEAILRARPEYEGYAIQGEVVGPKVQGNRLNLPGPALFVFNIYDTNTRRYLAHDELRAFLASVNLPVVAELERGSSFAYDQDALLTLAEGKYPNTNNEREGIVIRPLTEADSPTLGGRLSFKAISNRFLLKESD